MIYGIIGFILGIVTAWLVLKPDKVKDYVEIMKDQMRYQEGTQFCEPVTFRDKWKIAKNVDDLLQ